MPDDPPFEKAPPLRWSKARFEGEWVKLLDERGNVVGGCHRSDYETLRREQEDRRTKARKA